MAKGKKKRKGFLRRLLFWIKSSSSSEEEEESAEEKMVKKEERREIEPHEEEKGVMKFHEKCLIPVCRDPKIAAEEVKHWSSLKQVEFARPSTIQYYTDILEWPIHDASKQGSEKKVRPTKVPVYKVKGNKAVEIKVPKAPRESKEMTKMRTRDTQTVPPAFKKSKFMKDDDSIRTAEVPVRKPLVSKKVIKAKETAEPEEIEKIAEMETAPEMPKIRTRDTQEAPPAFKKSKFMEEAAEPEEIEKIAEMETAPEMPKIRTRDTQEAPPAFKKSKFMEEDDSIRTEDPVRKPLVSKKSIKAEEAAESEEKENIVEMETASPEARRISREKKMSAKIDREGEQKELAKLDAELETEDSSRGEERWKEITETKVFGRKGKKYWKKVAETKALGEKGVKRWKKVADTKVLGKKSVRHWKKVINSKVIGKYEKGVEISPMMPEERMLSDVPETPNFEGIIIEEESKETTHPMSPESGPKMETPTEESMMAEETDLGKQKELQRKPIKKLKGITRSEIRKPQIRQEEERPQMYDTTLKPDKGTGVSKKHPIITERRQPITKAKRSGIRATSKYSKKDRGAMIPMPPTKQQKQITGPKPISERKKEFGHPEEKKEQRTQKQISTESKRKEIVVKDEVLEEPLVIAPEEELFPDLSCLQREEITKLDSSPKLEIDKGHVESEIETIAEIPRQQEEQIKGIDKEQIGVEENALVTGDETLKALYDEKVATSADKWRKIAKAKGPGKKGVKKWKKVIQSKVLEEHKGDVSEKHTDEIAVKPTAHFSIDEDTGLHLVGIDDKKPSMQRETLETDSEIYKDVHPKSTTLDSSGGERWKRITQTKVLGHKDVKKWKATVQSKVLGKLKRTEEIPSELYEETLREQKLFEDEPENLSTSKLSEYKPSRTSDTVTLTDIKKASITQMEHLDQSGITPEDLAMKASYKSFGHLKEETVEVDDGQFQPKLPPTPVELAKELEHSTVPQPLASVIQESKISKEDSEDIALQAESDIKGKGKLPDDFGSFIKSQSVLTIPEEEISEDLQKEIITEAIERGIISHPDYPEPSGKEMYEEFENEFIPETVLEIAEGEIREVTDDQLMREEESIRADRERKIGNAESEVVSDVETAELMEDMEVKESMEGINADEISEETSNTEKEEPYPEFQGVDKYPSLEIIPETDILIMPEETPIDSKSEVTMKSESSTLQIEVRGSTEKETLLDFKGSPLPQEVGGFQEDKIKLEKSDEYREKILDSEISIVQYLPDHKDLEEIPETSAVPEKEVIEEYEDAIKETDISEDFKRKSSTPRYKEHTLSDEEITRNIEKKPRKKKEISIKPKKEVAQGFQAEFKGDTEQTEEQETKHLDEELSEQEMHSLPKTKSMVESILSSEISSLPEPESFDTLKVKRATDESTGSSEDNLEEEISPESISSEEEYEMKTDSLGKLQSVIDRDGKKHESIAEEIISEEDIPDDIETENMSQEDTFSSARQNRKSLKEEITRETESVVILNGRKSEYDKSIPNTPTEKKKSDGIIGQRSEKAEDSLQFNKKGHWRKIKLAVKVGQRQRVSPIITTDCEQTEELNRQCDNGTEITKHKREVKAKRIKNSKYVKEDDVSPSVSAECENVAKDRENVEEDETAEFLCVEQGTEQSCDRMESISKRNRNKMVLGKITNSTRFLDRVKRLRQQRKVAPALIQSGETETVSMELLNGRTEERD